MYVITCWRIFVFCRFLEVDGECVVNLADSQLYKLLNSKATAAKVVILRESVNTSVSDEDVEALREDLSLALLEIESLQGENRQLTAELEL